MPLSGIDIDGLVPRRRQPTPAAPRGRSEVMSRLRLWIAMSLDGFVAGPGQDVENPLGVGGMHLHDWVFPLAAWPGVWTWRDISCVVVCHERGSGGCVCGSLLWLCCAGYEGFVALQSRSAGGV